MNPECNVAEPAISCRTDGARGNEQVCDAGLNTGTPEKACSEPPRGPSEPIGDIRQLWREVRALHLSEARQGLEAVEQRLITGDVGSERSRRHADLLAIHAVALALDDDSLSAAAAADYALRRGASENFARLARLVERFCAWKAGTAPESTDDLTPLALQATRWSRPCSPDEVLADVVDLSLAAAIKHSRLQIPEAERLARCALRRAERMPMLSAAPASILGRILYAQGALPEAEHLLRSRLPVVRASGSLDCVGYTYGVLARIAAHGGDRATARATLDEARQLAEARNWPRLLAAVLAESVCMCDAEEEQRASLWLAQLHNLTERHRPAVRCARSDIASHLFRAQVYGFLKFRTGEPPDAALAWLRHEARVGQDLETLAWVNLAEAQLLWAEGDQHQGVCRLAEVLRTVEATGLQQLIVDAGSCILPLLEKFLQRDGVEQGLLAFAISLLDRLDRPVTRFPVKRGRATRGGDGLTLRERDVLRLIGEGRTNKSIAQIRGVAPETIKTHVKNIFVKLGVERRAQAVAKAERLGVLRSQDISRPPPGSAIKTGNRVGHIAKACPTVKT